MIDLLPGRSVLLLSGGIDSYVTYQILKNKADILSIENGTEFDTLYFDLGLPYTDAEFRTIKDCDKDIRIVSIKCLDLDQVDPIGGFIPNRNLLFFTLASSYGYRNIMICSNSEDRINDNTPQFHKESSNILSLSLDTEIKIFSPVQDMTKYELCQHYIDEDLGTPLDLAFRTFSCYNPTNHYEECLTCKACFRKNVVLHKLGYTRKFKNKELVRTYLKDTGMSSERSKDIISYASSQGINL